MASTISSPMLHCLSVHRVHTSNRGRSVKVHVSKPALQAVSSLEPEAVTVIPYNNDGFCGHGTEFQRGYIPLFGIKKKLKKAEESAVEIEKEGVETAKKGIATAEKEMGAVEKEIETAISISAFAHDS